MKTELLKRRTYNAKVFDLGARKRAGEFHAGHIHYKHQKDFYDIDTKLLPTVDGWYQDKASYNVQIPKYADGLVNFTDVFEGKSNEILMKPVASHIEGQLNETEEYGRLKQILYKDAFGKDIDLRITAGNISFRKEIIIRKKPDKDLEFRFEINLPDQKIATKDGTLDLKQNTAVSKEILVGDTENEKLFTRIKQARVWDSNGLNITIPLHFEVSGGKTYLIKKIPKKLLENAVYPVYTDDTTSFYAGAGDGTVAYRDGLSWDQAHDAATGTQALPTTANVWVGTYWNGSTLWYIYRAFYPIDTSGIGAGNSVTAAVLYIEPTTLLGDVDSGSYVIVQTTQNSTATLVTADYDQVGTTDGGSNALSNWTVNQYNTITMNATGREWVVVDGTTKIGIRSSIDIADAGQSSGFNAFNNCRFSEYADTGSDPYLYVEWSAGAEPTAYYATCTEVMDIVDTISPITSYKKTITDSVGMAEVILRQQALNKTITDNLTLSEITVGIISSFKKTLSDIITITQLKWAALTATLTESISLVETWDRATTFKKSLTEAISLDEVLGKISSYAKTLTESISLNDVISKIRAITTTLIESITLSEPAIQLRIVFNKLLTEAITLIDSVQASLTSIGGLVLTETLHLVDTIKKQAGYSKTFLENLSLVESFSLLGNYIKTLTESITLDDVLSKIKQATINLSEEIGLSDAITKITTFAKTITEHLTLNDILTAAKTGWTYLTKNVSSWTEGTKHTSSWTEQNKAEDNPTWTNQTKN